MARLDDCESGVADRINGKEIVEEEVVEPTPLPMVQMGIAVLIQLCEAMEINVLFPFMAFMVEDFGITGAKLGFYVGVLASGFGFGQIFSSLIWGRLSDRYGRKPVLVLGTLSAGVAMLVFGSAKNYPQAVFGRFLSGFMSGNLGVLKCVLTESTDNSNRVAGFGVISLSWFSGCIISPLIGGMLSGIPVASADGVPRSPQWFWSMLAEYPYLLPCLCCAAFNIGTALLTVLYLKETRWQNLADQQTGGCVGGETEDVATTAGGAANANKLAAFEQSATDDATNAPLTPVRVRPIQTSAPVPEPARSAPLPMSSQARLSPVPEGSTHSGSQSASSQSSLYASLASSAGTGVPRHFLAGYEKSPSPRKRPGQGHGGRSTDVSPVKHRRARSGSGGVSGGRDNSGGWDRDSSPSKSAPPSQSNSHQELSALSHDAMLELGIELGHMEAGEVPGEQTPLMQQHMGYGSSHSSCGTLAPIMEAADGDGEGESEAGSEQSRPVRTSLELLADPCVSRTTVNYGLLILATIMLDETLPLFLKQSNDTGGLGFNSADIGVLLSFTGVVALVYGVYILPRFNACNKQMLFNIASLGMIPCFMVWPLIAAAYNQRLHHAGSAADATAAEHVLWVSLGVTNIVRNCFVSLVFTVVMIQVSNSVETYELGGVNGLGQLMSSIGRCLGPVVGGFLWSYGVHQGILYLNFLTVSVVLLLSCAINNTLPASLELAK